MTFLVRTIDWLGVSYTSQQHVDDSKTIISIIREEDKEYKFSIGGPDTVLPPHGPRPTINHVRTLHCPWNGYAQFVGTSCIGTTSHEFVEMALYPAYFWVGASRVHDRSDGVRLRPVRCDDRPTNGNKTLPTLRPLRRRISAFIAEEPLVVEEDDDDKHEDPEYGGAHSSLRSSCDRGVQSAEGVGFVDGYSADGYSSVGEEMKQQLAPRSTRLDSIPAGEPGRGCPVATTSNHSILS